MAEEELAEAIELEDETEEVPDNFVDQMASRIGIILQREMDPTFRNAARSRSPPKFPALRG